MSGNDQLMFAQISRRRCCGYVEELVWDLKIFKIPLCIPLISSRVCRISIEACCIGRIDQNNDGQIVRLCDTENGARNPKSKKEHPFPNRDCHPSLPGPPETFSPNARVLISGDRYPDEPHDALPAHKVSWLSHPKEAGQILSVQAGLRAITEPIASLRDLRGPGVYGSSWCCSGPSLLEKQLLGSNPF
jgi:hypothetical protein